MSTYSPSFAYADYVEGIKRTLALNDNMAHFSALANDLGYENVFAEQLATLVDAGDVVIAISARGRLTSQYAWRRAAR